MNTINNNIQSRVSGGSQHYSTLTYSLQCRSNVQLFRASRALLSLYNRFDDITKMFVGTLSLKQRQLIFWWEFSLAKWGCSSKIEVIKGCRYCAKEGHVRRKWVSSSTCSVWQSLQCLSFLIKFDLLPFSISRGRTPSLSFDIRRRFSLLLITDIYINSGIIMDIFSVMKGVHVNLQSEQISALLPSFPLPQPS